MTNANPPNVTPLRQGDKTVGTAEQAGPGGHVYFGVTVSRQRAEYLMRCLDEPLCKACGREEAECSANPCQART